MDEGRMDRPPTTRVKDHQTIRDIWISFTSRIPLILPFLPSLFDPHLHGNILALPPWS